MDVGSKPKKAVELRKPRLPKKPEPVEPTNYTESTVVDSETPITDQSKLKELFTAWMSAEEEESKKIADPEPVQLPQQITTEPSQPQQITSTETEEKAEALPVSKSCFGYLSRREKGTVIPDTCIECTDSLNCMLSQYNKSGASVKEISKWYK